MLKYRILITGANRGIGFELATRLSGRGHTVVGTYRPQTREDQSVAELKSKGIETLEAELADEDSIIAAAKALEDQSLDVIINCAGLYYMWDEKPFMELSAEDFMTHFRVNTMGPFLVSKHFLPHLGRSRHGPAKIINISSDFASISENQGGNACYRVSKCALNQLTKTMAVDFDKSDQDRKVITLAVHPGYVPTKMTGYIGEDDMDICMTALVQVIEIFGTQDAPAELVSGAYAKWDGTLMKY